MSGTSGVSTVHVVPGTPFLPLGQGRATGVLDGNNVWTGGVRIGSQGPDCGVEGSG